MKIQQIKILATCGVTLSLATSGVISPAHAGFNDGRGKEWRQLIETTGLSWDQVAQIAPQDGVTPAVGSVGGRDFSGWVWATEQQVAELFSIWAPAILDSPELSVGGPEYLTPAAQFHSVFFRTYHISGCPTYQPCFNYTQTAGWDARGDGSNLPMYGEVASETWGWFPSASFHVGAASASSSTPRGVFLWRPTGLDNGGIYAYDDAGQSPSPSGGTAVNVFANDWLAGARPTAATVALTQLSPTIPGVTLFSDGSIVVAAGTPVDAYTLAYQICDLANPANCADAVATITVKSFPILAVNDSGSVSFGAGGTPVANVLANDKLGGLAATTTVVSLAQVSSSHAGITLNVASGSVNVAPGTPHGTHTLTYMICEKANPANCAQATVTLQPYSIDAVNDSWRLSSKTGASSPSVLNNDWFNGARATTAKVKITLVSTLPKGITFNTSTGVFTVAPKTESGTYTFLYRISEIASPANLDQATVTLDLSGKSN